MSGNLAKLEQELQMMAEGEEVAKEEEVVAGLSTNSSGTRSWQSG